ncbi:MAG: tetratricopeptide repeat protein [Planctomycetota bacterium]
MMRRTVNGKLVLILMGATLAAGAALFAAHSVQADRTAELFLREAQKAREVDEFDRAIRSYRSHLNLLPDSVDAREEYAQLLFELNDFGNAGAEFEHLLRLAPEMVGPRRRAAECALKIGRYSDCLDHLTRLLESTQDAELYEWLGRCQVETRRFAEAAQSLRASVEKDSARLDVYALLSQLLVRELDQPEEAERVIAELTTNNPNQSRAFLLRAQFEYANAMRARAGGEDAVDRFTAAESLADRAATLDPTDTESLLLAVRCASASKRPEKAKAYALRALANDPKSASSFIVLAELAVVEQGQEEAIDWYQQGIENVDPDDDAAGQLALGLALLFIDLERIDEARELIERLASSKVSTAMVRVVKGRLDLRLEKWQSASEHFESARLAMVDRPEVLKLIEFNLGECYRETDRFNAAIDAYRRAIVLDAAWVSPRLALVGVLELVGRSEAAYAELETIVGMGGVPVDAWISLAQRSVTRNLRAPPNEQDWSTSQAILEKAKLVAPGRAELAVLDAEIAARLDGDGTPKEVSDSFNLENATKDEKRMVLLGDARIALRRKDWERTEAWLDLADSELGLDVAAKTMRATYFISRYGEGAIDRIRQLIDSVEDEPGFDEGSLRLAVASIANKSRLDVLARELYEQLVTTRPADVNVWSLGIILATTVSDQAMLTNAIERLAANDGDEALLHYGRASALRLGAADDPVILKRALDHLARAKVLRPAWTRPLVLEAEILIDQGESSAATELLTRAIELGERTPRVVRNTALLLYKQGRFQNADSLLRLLDPEQISSMQGLGRAASLVSVSLNDVSRGLDVARAAAKNSSDAMDHIWHGTLVQEVAKQSKGKVGDDQVVRGLINEAIEAYRQAIELSPEAPLPWIRLVSLLCDSGEKAKAIRVADEAKSRLAPELLDITMAQCYERLSNLEQAASSYQAALEAPSATEETYRTAIAFYLRRQLTTLAEIRLNEMMKLEELSSVSLAWARRQFAALAVVSGRLDRLRAAQSLIGKNLAEFPGNLADERAAAMIWSALPGETGKAIEAWKGIVESGEAVQPNDHFQFALVLEQSDQWAAAAAELRVAIAGGDELRTSLFMQQYVAWLLKRDELADARLWLDRLHGRPDLEADTLQSFEIELFVREGSPQSALNALTQLVDIHESVLSLARTASLAEKASRLLDNAADRRPFQSLARNALKKAVLVDKTTRFSLARLLLSQGMPEQAVELIASDEIKKSELAAAIPTIDFLVLSGALTNEQLRSVQRLTDGLEQRFGSSSSISGLRASLAKQQDQDDKAIEIYRGILANEPNNVIALNNLAVVLSEDDSQLDRAAELSEKTMTIAGRIPALLDTRAMIAIASGETKMALKLLQEASKSERNMQPVHLFHRAVAQLELGNQQEATKLFRLATEKALTPEKLGKREQGWFQKLLDVS